MEYEKQADTRNATFELNGDKYLEYISHYVSPQKRKRVVCVKQRKTLARILKRFPTFVIWTCWTRLHSFWIAVSQSPRCHSYNNIIDRYILSFTYRILQSMSSTSTRSKNQGMMREIWYLPIEMLS